MAYPRIASLQTSEQFQNRIDQLGLAIPHNRAVSTAADSPLASSAVSRAGKIGNRFCILPMEGWDGTEEGEPSDLTRRRWQRFGLSGAKLIWGGEAVAVRHDGRANPRQLVLSEGNLASIAALRQDLVEAHAGAFGNTDDLCIGLQLTHSGRYAVPAHRGRAPRIAYRHPLLDQRVGVDSDASVLSDDDLLQLTDDFIEAARLARQAGFQWVDIKHCHGYLGHELLSGFDRPGRFGGSFENRTLFLRTIVDGIRASVPDLELGVRVSVFDFVPFQAGEDGIGIPAQTEHYAHAFGGDDSGQGIDLEEPRRFLQLLSDLNIDLVSTTCGSPYYNPHIQRPALFPPSDGYQPPEDPLVGVHRQLQVTAELKRQFPHLLVTGSGYSYLQDWLPSVAEAVIQQQMADFIGLGRMVLSYPELPADVLAGRPLKRKRICRTFSDCTTAPRNGLVSGCFPLDDFYKQHDDRALLAEAKRRR